MLEVLIMAENSSGKPGGMPGRPIGTVRVDITHQDHKTFEAVFKTEDKSFQLMIDEPEIRGGKGTGPTPLGYFVTGAASCLMMQYANVLKEKPMAVESIKMLARAHNDRDARVFTDMVYQVELTGSLSEADAQELAKAASARCFVENTIAKSLPITTDVSLNGKKVVSFTRNS
jgi:uncharacterized OsmC-like protein